MKDRAQEFVPMNMADIKRNMIKFFAKENSESTISQEESSSPRREPLQKIKHGLQQFAGIVPQGIELRLAERHEAKRQREEEKLKNLDPSEEDNATSGTSEKSSNAASPKHKHGPSRTPNLLTSSRVASSSSQSQVWIFAWSLTSGLLNFHMLWSYLVVAMLILHPLSTFGVIVAFITIASVVFAICDLVVTFIEGNDIKELSQKYIDYGFKKWREFRRGEGRRFVLIVIGIIMDPNAQRMVENNTNINTRMKKRRSKRARADQQSTSDS